MNRREFIAASACAAAMPASASELTKKRYEIGALYFPGWHPDARMQQQHGKGWTEWELLKRAEPKFPGHHQPKKPTWGLEDESDPNVFQKKISAAADAGLNHFIFDWYWYDGAPFLNRCLDSGYLGAPNKDRIKFALMWANHEWVDSFPTRLHEVQRPVVYPGVYNASEFAGITSHIISSYFREPSYYKVDGAPYFSIYELKHLIERMGGLEIARKAIDQFRDSVKAAGFPDLHLNAIAGGINGLQNLPELLPSLGIKSVTSYTWVHQLQMPAFPATEYASFLGPAEDYWRKAPERFGVPYHPDVTMGWDSSPRSLQSDRYEQAGYGFMPVLTGNTPQMFRSALARAKAHMDSNPEVPRIVTINSWNEWTEGSHLEPEARYGMDYLNAIRDVFGGL